MTARRSEPHLVARPYTPPGPERPARSIGELVRELLKPGEIIWPEVRPSDRGLDISKVRFRGAERRDLVVGTDASGGYLRPAGTPRTVVEYVGSQILATKAGAFVDPSPDLVPIPRVTGEPTFSWVGEGGPAADADPTFGVCNMKTKTGVVAVDYSWLLNLATGGASDEIISRELLGAVARGVDAAVFGTGGGDTPVGIAGTTGVDSRSGATFALATGAAMLKVLEDAGVPTDLIAWCMAPDVAETLRQRPKISGGEIMLLRDDGRMLGRPCFVSSGIGSGTLVAGDFSRVVVHVQRIELLLNLFSQSKKAVRELLAFWHGDIAVTRPKSFAIATGVS